jgi:predicted PurR-regulated permease PerM
MVPANVDRDYRGFSLFTYHVLVVMVVAALALLIWRIAGALLLAFVGVLLAAALRGMARLLGRCLRIPTEWALLPVAVVIIAVITLFVWFAGPRIDAQLAQLIKTLPDSIRRVEEWLKQYPWGQYILSHVTGPELSAGQGFHLFTRFTGIASTAFAMLADLIIVLFTAIYFAINPDTYRRGIVSLIPKSKTQRVTEVLDATALTLQHWLLGQGVSMLSVGILVAVGLWIAGVPMAFLLGVIAGALEFIPFIGPIASAIPGILIALTQNWTTALYALIVYVIVQQVENHLLIPLIQRKAVEVPPALVILAVAALGLLFGVLGALVATPLMAVILVWVKMFYVQDVLGKSVEVK